VGSVMAAVVAFRDQMAGLTTYPSRLRDLGRRSGQKPLDQMAQQGDVDFRKQVTWGMSDRILPIPRGHAPFGPRDFLDPRVR
jgi:hypothetical protein